MYGKTFKRWSKAGASVLLGTTLAVGLAPAVVPAALPQAAHVYAAHAAEEATSVSITDSETYTLEADKLVSTMSIKGNIDATVDLGGHTLTLTEHSLAISDGARVTFKNGTIEDKLPAPEQENAVNATFSVKGSGTAVTLDEGVTVKGAACAMYAQAGASAVVKGAAISSQGEGATIYAVDSGTSVKLTSGNIASENGPALTCFDGASITVEDGIVYVGEHNAIQTGEGEGYTAGSIDVRGGEFFGSKNYGIVSCPDGLTPVSGGIFHGALSTKRVKAGVPVLQLDDVDDTTTTYVGTQVAELEIPASAIAYVVQPTSGTVAVKGIAPGATVFTTDGGTVTLTDGTVMQTASTSYLDAVKQLKKQLAEALQPDLEQEAAHQAEIDDLETRLVQASVPRSLSAKAKAGKKAAITWKAPAYTSVNGYTVEYKLKTAKKWTVKDAGAKTKLTLSKLKAGKTYQVRVKGYKTVAGEKISTGYTAVKTAKAKK